MGKTCVVDKCGKFVVRGGDLCKNHKAKADTARRQETFQNKLAVDLKAKQKFEESRLANQRRRNCTSPSKFRKRPAGEDQAEADDQFEEEGARALETEGGVDHHVKKLLILIACFIISFTTIFSTIRTIKTIDKNFEAGIEFVASNLTYWCMQINSAAITPLLKYP